MKIKWKNLVIKAVIFLLVVLCLDLVIGKTYRMLENKALESSPYGMVTEYTMTKVNTDMVIIGASETSHSYIPALLEDSLALSVYNCGKDGCFFYYQNAMIQGILDRYSPQIILWSISPTELNEPTETDKARLSQLNSFYANNSFCRDVLAGKSKYEPLKLMSNLYTFNSRLFPYLYKIVMPDYSFEKGGYAPLYGSRKDLTLKQRIWEDNYSITCKEVFSKTLDRCANSGVKVICIFTPRYEDETHSNLITYQELKKILSSKGVPLIESLYHDTDLMSPSYFKDRNHLNDEGAVLFNEKLISIIRDYIQ